MFTGTGPDTDSRAAAALGVGRQAALETFGTACQERSFSSLAASGCSAQG